MTKPQPLLCALLIVMFLMAASAVYYYADEIDAQPVEIEQETPAPAEQIIICRAEAFNVYGHDANGVDYGPGYVIISDQSDIPLYSLLEIDQYGEGQVLAVSAELTIKALAARGMRAWAAGSVSATTPGAARSALEGTYR